MKHYPDTPEGFAQFLKDGEKRLPRLYGAKAEKAVEPPKEAKIRPLERLKEGLQNIEEVDWKLRASGDDAEEVKDSEMENEEVGE